VLVRQVPILPWSNSQSQGLAALFDCAPKVESLVNALG